MFHITVSFTTEFSDENTVKGSKKCRMLFDSVDTALKNEIFETKKEFQAKQFFPYIYGKTFVEISAQTSVEIIYK